MLKMKKQTINNAIKMLKTEGIIAVLKRTVVHYKYMKLLKKHNRIHNFKDVLFINGCPIDYCERYRVHHKMQELMAYGISVDEVVPGVLTEEIIKFYRTFVIYRMPFDENIEQFIDLVHQRNKVVFYDMDDLVFDLEYIKSIKELNNLTTEQREEYEDGVIRYGKLLSLCDYGITTTSVIAEEMKKKVKDVCIDKNIASIEMQKYSELAIKNVVRDEDTVVIGYASGSFTHNADFKLVLPALIKLLEKYENVYLKLIGAIEVPEELEKYGNKVLTQPFVDYKKLPNVIRSLDINLAPLESTFFNSAKSSIKWMEAGFVKVPTVASNVGDFKESITDGVDGVLCNDDEWFLKLEELVKSKELREKIGNNVYKTVNNCYTPLTSGKKIADFIKSKLAKNICFVIPAANISGGILVAVKHALMMKDNGYDVTMINTDSGSKDVTKLYYGDDYVPVVSVINNNMDMQVDVMVATMWFTLFYAQKYAKCSEIKYLVQGKESMFYKYGNKDALRANSTYNNVKNVDYLTVSKWCYEWLKDDFLVDAKYVLNGIDKNNFPYKERKFNGKIKILVEGDSASFYKNVDESFEITNRLDKEKFEIHYLSYNGKPKSWYEVDNFYHQVNYNEVYKIYQDCDILLKSSKLESFSYPPLEMMATGGVCVVAPNEGNVEFLEDNVNCLMYEGGNIEDAIEKIEKIVADKNLRKKIVANGLKTVEAREWKNIEKDLLKVYGLEMKNAKVK